MLNLKAALLALGLAISQVNAHFLLLSPTSAGFDDNKEDVNPCGGFVPNFDNSTDFFVDGDSIAVQSTHPVANWLFRATLDDAAAGNWTNLVPSILQNGVGDFCKTDVTVPASYAGQQGVIQIIQEATDGALYQVCPPILPLSRTILTFSVVCRSELQGRLCIVQAKQLRKRNY
jgi:hypothetical protein